MGKTTLKNNAPFNVQVKEGNSNIFRNLQLLKQGSNMTIQADTSATYREYVLVLLPDNKKLRPLTSDDIEELSAVEIFLDEDTGEVDWRKAERKTLLDFFFGLFSSKSGAKADAKADAKANVKAEADAESSKSPTRPQ